MSANRNTQLKKLFVLLIAILWLGELTWSVIDHIRYNGIFAVLFIGIMAGNQVIGWYRLLLNNSPRRYYAIRIMGMSLLTLMIPLFYLFPPQYTYYEGKSLVEKEAGRGYQVTDDRFGHRTIPTTPSNGEFLQLDKMYYYALEHVEDKEYRYFVVDQNTGKIQELEDRYW